MGERASGGAGRSDGALLAALLRWAPIVVVVAGAGGVVVGLVAITHDRSEIRLLGASLVLLAAVSALLALTAVLIARAAVERWGPAPAVGDVGAGPPPDGPAPLDLP